MKLLLTSFYYYYFISKKGAIDVGGSWKAEDYAGGVKISKLCKWKSLKRLRIALVAKGGKIMKNPGKWLKEVRPDSNWEHTAWITEKWWVKQC